MTETTRVVDQEVVADSAQEAADPVPVSLAPEQRMAGHEVTETAASAPAEAAESEAEAAEPQIAIEVPTTPGSPRLAALRVPSRRCLAAARPQVAR
jgi:hypothetical protein